MTETIAMIPTGYDPVTLNHWLWFKYQCHECSPADFQRLFENVTWKDLLERGMVIAGSPETVRQRMEELIKSLRVGHVFCLLHSGNQPDDKTRHSTRLFAERVMPRLRGLWPEREGDDRWWIHPLEERVRPGQPAAARP